MADWKKIKAEYIRGGTSYRKLASKYGVSFSTIKRHAADEKWTDLRAQVESNVTTKIIESATKQASARVDEVQTIADMLLAKIKQGLQEETFGVDESSIRQLVSCIKDLREIKGYKHELDMQEQQARIEKLRKDAQVDSESKDIKITISSELEAYSE